MREIQQTKGMVTIVDDEDYEWLNQWKWHYCGKYACRRNYPDRKYVFMHRQIMNTPVGMETDHINRDKLDNRKTNLRICTKSDNSLNRPISKNNTSGFKGINFPKDKKKWKAIHMSKHIGYFNTKEEAARAYDAKVKENPSFQFAELNFPNE